MLDKDKTIHVEKTITPDTSSSAVGYKNKVKESIFTGSSFDPSKQTYYNKSTETEATSGAMADMMIKIKKIKDDIANTKLDVETMKSKEKEKDELKARVEKAIEKLPGEKDRDIFRKNSERIINESLNPVTEPSVSTATIKPPESAVATTTTTKPTEIPAELSSKPIVKPPELPTKAIIQPEVETITTTTSTQPEKKTTLPSVTISTNQEAAVFNNLFEEDERNTFAIKRKAGLKGKKDVDTELFTQAAKYYNQLLDKSENELIGDEEIDAYKQKFLQSLEGITLEKELKDRLDLMMNYKIEVLKSKQK
jgi:hypothetical protein